MTAVADAVMQRFFTPERLSSNATSVANVRRVLLSTNRAGYAGCCAAVRDLNQTSILARFVRPR